MDKNMTSVPISSEARLSGHSRTLPFDLFEHGQYVLDLVSLVDSHTRQMSESAQKIGEKNVRSMGAMLATMATPEFGKKYLQYLLDFSQRSILFLDALRQRSIDFIAHEQGTSSSVLVFEHEVIIDGCHMQRPVNYSLVRIIPPAGTLQREDGRPYIIIDPRAGHRSGIGGFKQESEVGCAINAGHPVYFVTFSRLPEPEQTLADVCAAEAEFVREAQRRHPKSPKPIIVGNKLARGQANLDERTHVVLRAIQSPVIIFASHGDNITPPPQAVGCIADNYNNVEEIKARGQRILYTLHDSVGHLGIFVSSKIAKKQHQAIVSTLKAIEVLAPGLYEMTITEELGEGVDKKFSVAFEERQIDQMLEQAGGWDDNKSFATVARFSELSAELYDLMVRPLLKPLVNRYTAEALAASNPLRVKRYLLGEHNLWLAGLPMFADSVRKQRCPVEATNPFRQLKRLGADMITQWWDGVRDLQDFWIEFTFHWLYSSPAAKALGDRHYRRISEAPPEDLRVLGHVQDALDRVEDGGFAEGVVRMLLFLARSRKGVRRSRLERANQILETTEPFASMKPKHRTRLIHRESLIVAFEPGAAMESLPKLIRIPEERVRALEICWKIAGPREEMSEETVATIERLGKILEMTPKSIAKAEAMSKAEATP
jgi:hypothetical protein